jgi:hypothetical protein
MKRMKRMSRMRRQSSRMDDLWLVSCAGRINTGIQMSQRKYAD